MPTVLSLVEAKIRNCLVDAENAQLLNGSGAGISIKGLNAYTAPDGAIIRPKSTDTRLDALDKASRICASNRATPSAR